MKKILYVIFSIVLFSSFVNFAHAQETSVMPSDEEIMETIKKFNFDESQQQYLFKETKKQLELMYQNGNALNELQNLDTKKIEKALDTTTSTTSPSPINATTSTSANEQTQESSLRSYIPISEVDEINPENKKIPLNRKTSKEREKKYSNHDPLFVETKLGPNRSK